MARSTPSHKGPKKRSARKKGGPDATTLLGLGVVVIMVALGIAFALSDSGPAEATETAPVEITGGALSAFPEGVGFDESANGQPAPSASGSSFDDSSVDLLADEGSTIVVFLAHWCPHCRAEVPVIVDELGEALPDDVRLVGVATSTDPSQANYPPSVWLEAEDWPFDVLVDSEDSEISAAYGVRSFPAFAVVGADGNVVMRASGELNPEQLDALVQAAADAA